MKDLRSNTFNGFISKVNENKEAMTMIRTGKYKMYGQLEEQAKNKDIEAYVFSGGEIKPADQTSPSMPAVHTAPEKNY